MATNKPQFNGYVDQQTYDETAKFLEKTGVARGKLIENMWRFYNLRDVALLQQKVTLLASEGIPERDVPQLYQTMLVLQRALKDRME